MSQATYEYPAYALQIESLAPSVRDLFLQSFGQRAIKVNSIFSDSTLLFDPYFFAARAYLHFKASADGCCDFGWRGFLHCSANVVAWRVKWSIIDSGADPQPSSVRAGFYYRRGGEQAVACERCLLLNAISRLISYVHRAGCVVVCLVILSATGRHTITRD